MSLISGIITVPTAGTAIQGTDIKGCEFFIKALPTNTGYIYIGNNGQNNVESVSGYWLSAGENTYIKISNLKHVYFNSSVSGDKVCWMLAEG